MRPFALSKFGFREWIASQGWSVLHSTMCASEYTWTFSMAYSKRLPVLICKQNSGKVLCTVETGSVFFSLFSPKIGLHRHTDKV